ncbi:hypothetical protein FB468_1070 [Leucobacter komagatae]|uniref:Uncharacterized protein n=1 Tax=Leucobacter komagatae TaxID=55969 RepID=A0A542Y4P9_9MICO|nr:hypothetical protein FB468_1070 [Leucobacter komagatae]
MQNTYPVLGAGCWVLGAGCWVLGAGCWVLGRGAGSKKYPASSAVELHYGQQPITGRSE